MGYMKILMITARPEALTEYLVCVGHEVKECLSTDLAERMAEVCAPDVVLFLVDVPEVPPVTRKEALKALVPRYRVVLVSEKTDQLVTYAAALGVKDFAFIPSTPSRILHRLEHPARPEEAAEMMDGAGVNTVGHEGSPAGEPSDARRQRKLGKEKAGAAPVTGDKSEVSRRGLIAAKVRRCLEQTPNDAKVIAVYSPTTDSGKTLIAAGLAETLASHGIRTAFLDLDLAAGDATRVFRLADDLIYTSPTVTTWRYHPSFPRGCLRSESGVYVLPRPESFPVGVFRPADIVPGLPSQFEVTVADLGVDFRQYEDVLEKASVRLLVSDCDDKALFRIGAFLRRQSLSWTLVVNLREKVCKVSPEEVIGALSGSGRISESMVIPYLPRMEKMSPGTFKPDSKIAEELVYKVLGSIGKTISGGVGHEEGDRNLSRH